MNETHIGKPGIPTLSQLLPTQALAELGENKTGPWPAQLRSKKINYTYAACLSPTLTVHLFETIRSLSSLSFSCSSAAHPRPWR
jgi:hypothetical protein